MWPEFSPWTGRGETRLVPSCGKGDLGWMPFWPEGRLASRLTLPLRVDSSWIEHGQVRYLGFKGLAKLNFDISGSRGCGSVLVLTI